ncbi:MAG: thioredoxin domain-containing protein [Polyangiaceae bacterium]|nr:thioredoxin domain-containing protein [Polyangiaceae bacterium]
MSVEEAIEKGDFRQALTSLEHETSASEVEPSRLLMRFNIEVRLQRFDAAQATMRRLVMAAPEVAAPMSAFAAAAHAEELATRRRHDPACAGRGAALGLPPPHLLALAKAWACHANGNAHEAKAALAEAATLTPATSGTITRVGGGTQRFSAISDSDELTGATLPVYDGAKLLDLPFSELSSIAFLAPKTSFDVMWSAADIEMVDGTRLRGRIPSFYAGTGVADDGSVRTGQVTTWQHDRGYAEALGQRDWSVTLAEGGHTMVGILGVQRIDFDNARRAPRYAGMAVQASVHEPPASGMLSKQALPKAPGWGLPVAALGAFAGVAVFLYLGLLGGRAGRETVLGLLAVMVIAGIPGVIAGLQTIARKRVGLGIATIAIATAGILVGIGGVVIENLYRQSQREQYSSPPSTTYDEEGRTRAPRAPSEGNVEGRAAPKADITGADTTVAGDAIASVPIGTSPVRGPNTAKVTIVIFSDFECLYCQRVQPTLERIRNEYGDRVRFVWKDAPLPTHTRAEPAAQLARDVRAQKGDNAFWRAHDLLLQNQKALTDEDLKSYALELGANPNEAMAAVADHEHKAGIEADLKLFEALEVKGTPTFFINGRRLAGAQPFDKFKQMIDREEAAAIAAMSVGNLTAEAYYENLVAKGSTRAR